MPIMHQKRHYSYRDFSPYTSCLRRTAYSLPIETVLLLSHLSHTFTYYWGSSMSWLSTGSLREIVTTLCSGPKHLSCITPLNTNYHTAFFPYFPKPLLWHCKGCNWASLSSSQSPARSLQCYTKDQNLACCICQKLVYAQFLCWGSGTRKIFYMIMLLHCHVKKVFF